MTAIVTHAIVSAEGSRPNRAILFLHGIFGSGGNWRTFARRFVSARPEWAAILVDLRMHGASQGFAPPHLVESTAADLDALDAVLPYPVRGVVGHSFGGKVALAYIDRHGRNLSEAWILDSMPGARVNARGSESTMRALEVMASLPNETFPSREAFVQKLVDEGIARSVAQWLAMNLRAEERGAYRLRLDLAANRSQIENYFALDEWHVIERSPDNLVMHVVIGGQSGVFDAEDRKRIQRLADEQPKHIYVHVLEKAGHWVHVDDPDGLFAVMTAQY
jgi:pimeloyl-ACP methyl ester carboxylesterase